MSGHAEEEEPNEEGQEILLTSYPLEYNMWIENLTINATNVTFQTGKPVDPPPPDPPTGDDPNGG